MTDHWYCLDCDRRIDADERSRHTAADHRLRGTPLPSPSSTTAIRPAEPGETAIRPADTGDTAIRPVRERGVRLPRRRDG